MYIAFKKGLHALRRLWSGLSTDLVIEQVPFEECKTNGGLTRGRYITELQRAKILLAMPSCAEVNNAMQVITETSYITIEQNKESRNESISRDARDTVALRDCIEDQNLFTPNPNLCNISNEMMADTNVNVEKAQNI